MEARLPSPVCVCSLSLHLASLASLLSAPLFFKTLILFVMWLLSPGKAKTHTHTHTPAVIEQRERAGEGEEEDRAQMCRGMTEKGGVGED